MDRFVDMVHGTPAVRQEDAEHAISKIIFSDDDDSYVQSANDPTDTYRLALHREVLEQSKGSVDPVLQEIGPNERYLIHCLIHIPKPLMCLVGGIGVGKTSFCKFVLRQIKSVGQSLRDNPCPREPLVIYIDIQNEGIRSDVMLWEVFWNYVRDLIRRECLFTPEEEVWDVWNAMLEDVDDLEGDDFLRWLRGEIAELDPVDPNADLDDLAAHLEARKQIRSKILKSKRTRRGIYASYMLRYLHKHLYDRHPLGIIAVFDNIDRFPSDRARMFTAIRRIAQLSKVKVIAPSRHTTFFQDLDDGFSAILDPQPYNGPDPLDVIVTLLKRWLEEPVGLEVFEDQYEAGMFRQGLETLCKTSFNAPLFREIFAAPCGRSVRKAKMLARRLIHNSIFTPRRWPPQGGGTHQSFITRALIVGASGIYEDRHAEEIGNLWRCWVDGMNWPLAKIRLLALLRHEEQRGVPVKHILGALSHFGYEDRVVQTAANEIKARYKRLIWSDDVHEDFLDMKDSNCGTLVITSIGEGFLDHFCPRLEYVQEVMLDTPVAGFDGVRGPWNLADAFQRFELVGLFTEHLVRADIREMGRYLRSGESRESYEMRFGTSDLVTKRIIASVSASARGIAGSRRDRVLQKRETERYEELNYLVNEFWANPKAALEQVDVSV